MNKCSYEHKAKVTQPMLDKEWVSFIETYLDTILETKNLDPLIINGPIKNLVKVLKKLQFDVDLSTPILACQIYDNYFDLVYRYLNHPVMLQVASESRTSYPFKIIRIFLQMLQNFSRVNSVHESVFENTRSLLQKYVEILKDEKVDVELCNNALRYLVKDNSPYSQLSIGYLVSTEPPSDDIDQYIKNITYVLKRLESVSLEDHMTRPWKYHYDFR